jgi:orotate phosphoribosyltransferase
MSEPFLSSVRARRGHFKLESGHHGDFWLDLETLCLRPAHLLPFAAELASRLRSHDVAAVCGPLNEGAFVALLVASELDCDFTYAERFADRTPQGPYPVEYRLPGQLKSIVRGKRIAIVNDVISAGSAVRGAFANLLTLEARVVAIGALLVLGTPIVTFARQHRLSLETLAQLPHNLWAPTDCPLCRSGIPLELVSS